LVSKEVVLGLEKSMKKRQITMIPAVILFLGIALNAHAAVTNLTFGYGKTTSPDTLPTTWLQLDRPDSISYDYQPHEESFQFNEGEYLFFLVGLANIDLPGSLFIDKIELTGPSGLVPISNSGFENGTNGWSAWGSYKVDGDFSISSDAYEGSNAAVLTVSNSGQYSLRGQVPVAITQSGTYTLRVYTKVNEAQREIPPDVVFAMAVGNQWIYDSNVKEEVTALDTTTFSRDTFEMTISENDIEIGKEWYEVWKGYLRFWGIYDNGTFKFDFGLLAEWYPAAVNEKKASMAWVVNYGTTVDLTVDVLGIEPVTLSFATLDAYHFRYVFVFSGPGGTYDTTFDWWIVPYIGVVKQQSANAIETLVSFAIGGGNITETSDNDNDGLLGYMELITYNTDPNDSDSDNDGFSDGVEVNYGTDPNDPNSHPSRAMLWIPLLLLED
jgi:hypothetical protein